MKKWVRHERWSRACLNHVLDLDKIISVCFCHVTFVIFCYCTFYIFNMYVSAGAVYISVGIELYTFIVVCKKNHMSDKKKDLLVAPGWA